MREDLITRNLPEAKGFICMITNDGWWKNTPGYRHHYNFSPVRAIECRRDLVRLADTGLSGFYHIAKGANVPIVLGYLDYRRKVGGIGPVVHPTGNMEADMKIIQDFYADIAGKYPKKARSSPAPAEWKMPQ